jgi:hypothetical protein
MIRLPWRRGDGLNTIWHPTIFPDGTSANNRISLQRSGNQSSCDVANSSLLYLALPILWCIIRVQLKSVRPHQSKLTDRDWLALWHCGGDFASSLFSSRLPLRVSFMLRLMHLTTRKQIALQYTNIYTSKNHCKPHVWAWNSLARKSFSTEFYTTVPLTHSKRNRIEFVAHPHINLIVF